MPQKRRYDEIAAYFRRQIQDGELEPGAKLPSLRKVCDDFNVSMNTANRAFQMLKAEGLTTATLEGTVVAEREDIVTTGADRLARLNRTGKTYAPGETSTNHESMLRSVGDPKIAERLGLELHDEVLIRRRVFRAGGKPTSVGYSFFHPRAWAVVPELQQQGPLTPFWQTTYTERTGKEFSQSPQQRTARHASEREIADLEIEAPDVAAVPVLVVHTVFHTPDGPIECWEDVYTAGKWQADTE